MGGLIGFSLWLLAYSGPGRYEAVRGQLIFTPTNLRFDNVFPGLVLRKSIFATNTYPHPLRITNVESPDARLIVQYVCRSSSTTAIVQLLVHLVFRLVRRRVSPGLLVWLGHHRRTDWSS